MKPLIIVICGPTATGKSAYGVKLAKKLHGLNRSFKSVGRTSHSEVLGEIISADSRQVYRGLDIGSAKITKKEMRGIPHHLLDVASPKRQFSVVQYKKLAGKAIKAILKRGKIPILVGGTGFYIDAVIYNQTLPEVKPDKQLRKELEKLSKEELFTQLKKLDPERAKTIDKDNKVRLVRAIEIAKTLGKVPRLKKQTSPYALEIIYLDLSDEDLKKRIHKRNIKRIGDLIKEVQNLHDKEKLSWKRMEELGLEYRYTSLFLQGKINSKKELIEILDTKTWQYVKRQRTWFKKYNKST